MVLRNDRYQVTISVGSMPPLEAYDIVYLPEVIKTKDYYSARLLRIEQQGRKIRKVALVGTVTASAEPCAVLENDLLTVIVFNAILRIDLRTGEIIWRVDCGNMGGLLEIHAIEDGYILYGEGDIFRYDLDLNQIWWFSGRDILVSQAGGRSFWIESGLIHCQDWEGWHYVLDVEGDLISESCELSPGS